MARYAEPLLGERSYVAEQASRVEISRSRGGATLHESVCIRLDVDPDTDAVTWDSYRNPEGRWVVLAFHDGGTVGTWIYDEVGLSVQPQDESARALMGGGPSAVSEPAPNPSESSEPVGGEAEPEVELTPQEPERPRLVSVTSDPTASQAAREDSGAQEVLLSEQDVPQPPVSEQPKREKRAKGKRGRASVPSWDEILFGAAKKQD